MLRKRMFHLSLLLGCLAVLIGLLFSGRPQTATAQTEHFPVPGWITYLNLWRSSAGLPNVEQSLPLSQGSYAHSVYMLETGHLAHYEEPESEWYTDVGNQAAWRSAIAASHAEHSDFLWAIDYWVSTPFNLIPILDPKLELVGYGNAYRPGTQNNPPPIGGPSGGEELPVPDNDLMMTSNLDLWNGRLEEVPEEIAYPIMFPPDGGETWVIRHSLYEFPNPFSDCPEYQNPSGPGIVILLGDGSNSPVLQDHYFAVLMEDGEELPLEYCVFHETTYASPDEYEQLAGRQILDERDAVVILPRNPLEIERSYVASVTADGETHTWTFSTVRPPERLKEILAGN